MNDKNVASVPRLRGLARLAAALAVIGAGALYVNGGASGKEDACAGADKAAKAIDPAAKGEVAAMNIAKNPAPMPELIFAGPDGQEKKLADFHGKTLLLNVWATWCVPCREEMPALDRLQKEAGSDKFEVVTVNIDTTRLERPKAFLQEIGVKSLAFYSDPKGKLFFQLRQTGDILGLPTTFLVDPNGCKLGVMAGPAKWDSEDAKALVARAVQETKAP